MITVGNTIKMVNPIYGFDMAGKTFKVTSVCEDGTIVFEAPFGFGIMSPKELNEHFEIVIEEEINVIPKYVWTDWLDENDEIFGNYRYKTNGKKVKVQWNGYKATAMCHPDDSFNLESGRYIALGRAYLKYVLKEYGHVI